MWLSNSSLARLGDGIAVPAYDRTAVGAGIVHLGIGAFHRGHQAVYVDGLLAREPEWGIVGVSLRSAATHDALAPQDHLYTVCARGPGGGDHRVIGSVVDTIVAPKDADRLLTLMCDPAIRIVSLTVTEKGYCHDPATGDLDPENPAIKSDLACPRAPVTAPGYLTEALRRRKDAGIAPFTVLSCDNLPENGKTARKITTQYANQIDADFAKWIEDHVAFPSTMVDRIVPATTDEDRAEIAKVIGMEDAWPIITEPFSQWVIEDDFPAGRPAFDEAGAQLVADVEPFERMKLRMLNGSHSTLAYLGYLAGYETVAETMGDPQFERLIFNLMTEEVIPTLDMPGVDLAAYRDALIERFKNPGLQHRTWQIAMDGSQKLPQRLLDTIGDRLAAGGSIERLSLGVAAWMRYVTGVDENGEGIDVRDPLAARLKDVADRVGSVPDKLVPNYLAIGEIFGSELADAPVFRDNVVKNLATLYENGARGAIAAVT